MEVIKSFKELLAWLKLVWPALAAIPYVKYEAQLLSWIGASNVTLLRVAFGAVMLFLVAVAATIVLWQRSRPKLVFNQQVGAYVDKKGVWYCTSCKTSGKLSPLLKTKDHELVCQVATCKQFYYLPEYARTDWGKLYNS